MPRDTQQKLADLFSEAKPGIPRLISGSMRTAGEEVAAGKLVPDFHTELSVVELRVPPLRERQADLARLAAHFLPDIAVEPAAFAILRSQPWVGNLRELADTLASSAIAAGGGPIKNEHLPRELRVRAGIDPLPVRPKPLTLDPLLEAVERRLIALAMTRSQGNATKAAELLGVFRTRLSRRLEALGINRADENKT